MNLRASIIVWGAIACIGVSWVFACGGETKNGSGNANGLTSDGGGAAGGMSTGGAAGTAASSASAGAGCMPAYTCDSSAGGGSSGSAASGGGGPPYDGDASTDSPDGSSLDAGTDGADGACSYEGVICEFYSPWDCISGEVYAVVDPCWICGPSYWEPVLQCDRGCRIDMNAIKANEYGTWGLPDAEALCEENRPKEVGDACETDADCKPTFATYAGNNTYLPPEYLACDLATHACVLTEPPTISGYMDPCGAIQTSGDGYQLVSAPDCVTGLCFVTAIDSDGCNQQGCTALCSDDSDCPLGSICFVSLGACAPGYTWSDLMSAMSCAAPAVDQ